PPVERLLADPYLPDQLNRRVQAATVVLGDLTIQGNLKGVASIAEPLHVALENGAIRALVPISNKSQFAALPEETVEKLDVIFYGDVDRAVLKAIELLGACEKLPIPTHQD